MQGMSERQYAAHVGLSRGAIQKAKMAERLVLYPDGSINAAASDARRAETTDPSKTRTPPAPKLKPVDPYKDAMADLLAIRTGTMTLAQAIARQGHNPDAVLAEIAATNAKLDGLGLVLDSDPRRVTKTGSAQAGDPATEPTAPASEPEKE